MKRRLTMLRADNLKKAYRKRAVVRGVNIEVGPGEVVGLLGPNGAGKTTCFYMIVGLISADEGRILIDDTEVTHEPVNVRSGLGVGYLPQEASIFRKLSVRDNVMAILEMRQDLDNDGREEALQTLLESDDVAVTIDATHYCVKSRGVMDATSETTTTALGGIFKKNPATRAEFLHGIR